MTDHAQVPAQELEARLTRLRAVMDAHDPGWKLILINHKYNMYYLTGTMQDGVLTVTPDSATLWVRRWYPRAVEESLFPDIRPMRSFRELAAAFPAVPETVYLEEKTATLEWLGLIRKYLPFANHKPIGPVMSGLRAVKSAYEIDCMTRAGAIHADLIERFAHTILLPGVSEADVSAQLLREALANGAMGVGRFNQSLGEEACGLVSFGESALALSAFDGPGGTLGTCLAMPGIGSARRLLAEGDLVLLDFPCAVEGYHTDKSVIYHCGSLDVHENADEIRAAYALCVELEQRAAEQLRPGALPEEVWQNAQAAVPDRWQAGFMNGGKFLGHSIGLTMDEPPVLARSFRAPLEPGMTFAVEPKIALPGVGLVGTENTYLVQEDGPAKCLTGSPLPLTCL